MLFALMALGFVIHPIFSPPSPLGWFRHQEEGCSVIFPFTCTASMGAP